MAFQNLITKHKNKCFQYKKFLCTELISVIKNNNSIDIYQRSLKSISLYDLIKTIKSWIFLVSSGKLFQIVEAL